MRAVIEATVFEDSDLHRLHTLLPYLRESKNVVGYTFSVDLPGGFAGAQVFVDRVCEVIWEVKRENWRYENITREHLRFKRGVKSSDLRRFSLAYEYAVLHELLHDAHEETLTDEEPVHRSATILLIANR